MTRCNCFRDGDISTSSINTQQEKEGDVCMNIGIRNTTLQMSPTDALKTAGGIGFDGVELDIGTDYTDSLLWTAEGRGEILETAAESDCEVSSLCIGALWTISPASSDTSVQNEAVELISASAAIATQLGAPWILLPVTPGGEDVDHETCTARWIEQIAHVAPVAEDFGILYCLENVGRGCGQSADHLHRLVQGIDFPSVGVYYDIGNATAFGFDPVEEIHQLGDHIHAVHVKEREGDRLGEGIVDVRGSLEALMELGYDEWLVLETAPTDDPVAAAAYNLDWLRDLLDDIG